MKKIFYRLPKIIFVVVLFSISTSYSSAQSNDFEVVKNLDIYSTLFKEININYVDEINPGELMTKGIEEMLKTLDPYTNFIPESDIEDYRFITTGQYGGIGALIHKHGDYVIISEPYKDFPADKSGLKAGDKILEVNGESAIGKSTNDVSKVLKGQPGTELNLVIERPGIDEPFELTLERQKIKVPNIPYKTILANNIGYIKLSGFTQNAGSEVRKAFVELTEENELKGIILDLRGNGGGLLQEAVNTSNIFVDKGEHIVSTKGRLKSRNRSYNTMSNPVDTEIPLVVLVDNSSASASEIVAGAIQDLDRGVVLGQITFGKGLVQNVVPLSYNTQLKVTVAKYYIPSGRCIQAIDYSTENGNGTYSKIPDSLRTEFKTKNGRTVLDGKGIEPDIAMEPEKMSNIVFSLFSKHLIFDYATHFYWKHDSIESPEEFEISDDTWNDFVVFLSDKDYDYTSRTEEKLKELRKIADREHYLEFIEQDIEKLESGIKDIKANDLELFKDQIKKALKLEILTRYYYEEGRIIASLRDDPEVDKAIEVLTDRSAYSDILSGAMVVKKDKESGSSN